jgi:hypothetical protein
MVKEQGCQQVAAYETRARTSPDIASFRVKEVFFCREMINLNSTPLVGIPGALCPDLTPKRSYHRPLAP